MQYCAVVVSGLVMTIMGPFKSKKEAAKWIEAEQIKQYVIVPILSPGELEGEGASL